MLAHPSCPVCGASEWTMVGERTYRRPASLDESGRKPLRVLFEVWAPGEQTFHVRFAACNVCAMMIYIPRPSHDDIHAKYQALAGYGDNIPSLGEAPRRTRLRSQRLYDILVTGLARPVGECRILDFGGGDGRLLTRFVEAGAACDLADYCDRPVPGVHYVGRDLDSLPGGPTYDAIICSHVVEHLADPLPVLQRLVTNLKTDGRIYVEVPVEVVRRMPAGAEPVTHCNFFIPESLAALLERAGCHIVSNRLTSYPHPNGGWRLCAGAVAAPGAPDIPSAAGLPAIQRYLDPSLPFLLQVSARIWRSLPAMVGRKLRTKARSVIPGATGRAAAGGAGG